MCIILNQTYSFEKNLTYKGSDMASLSLDLPEVHRKLYKALKVCRKFTAKIARSSPQTILGYQSSPEVHNKYSPEVHHKLYKAIKLCGKSAATFICMVKSRSEVAANYLQQPYRKLFAATLPQCLRQICRNSSPEG